MRSVFTEDLGTCYYTGRTDHTEVHHIYPGPCRSASTRYGYVLPLHASIHPNGAFCTLSPERRRYIDLQMRQMAQRHFEREHGTREQFRQIFGRNYLEDDDG